MYTNRDGRKKPEAGTDGDQRTEISEPSRSKDGINEILGEIDRLLARKEKRLPTSRAANEAPSGHSATGQPEGLERTPARQEVNEPEFVSERSYSLGGGEMETIPDRGEGDYRYADTRADVGGRKTTKRQVDVLGLWAFYIPKSGGWLKLVGFYFVSLLSNYAEHHGFNYRYTFYMS